MSNKSQDCFLQRRQTLEVVHLQELALQNAEPDFDLIDQDALMGNQKTWKLNVPPWISHCACGHRSNCLGACVVLLSKIKATVCTPRRSASGMICSNSRLEIDEAFSLASDPIDQTVDHAQGTKEMQCSLTLVAVRDVGRMPRHCWVRWLRSLPGLDRGFLIGTDNPNSSF
jgi:hypothetical protein